MLLLALSLVAVPQDRHVFPGGDEDGARTITAAPRCDRTSDEIVVCGDADPERYRLRKSAPHYVETPVRATTRAGPGELSLEAEQRGFPQATAPAAMIRFRVPLGKKPK